MRSMQRKEIGGSTRLQLAVVFLMTCAASTEVNLALITRYSNHKFDRCCSARSHPGIIRFHLSLRENGTHSFFSGSGKEHLSCNLCFSKEELQIVCLLET